MSASPLRAAPPRIEVLEGLSVQEALARRDLLTLRFERRIRYRTGRGCWRDWRVGFPACRDLPRVVDLAIPPIADWTRDTIEQVITIARQQLRARGAHGRGRLTADVYSSYLVNVLELMVRVGDLRTCIRIDAGTIRFEIPGDVVSRVAALAPSPDLTLAVTLARAREHARTTGGA
jgi:hypothetical protein